MTREGEEGGGEVGRARHDEAPPYAHCTQIAQKKSWRTSFAWCVFSFMLFYVVAFCVLRNAFLWGFAFFTFFCVMSRALCVVHLCLVRAWCVISWFRGAIQTVGVIT